jgi:hypothetical protein
MSRTEEHKRESADIPELLEWLTSRFSGAWDNNCPNYRCSFTYDDLLYPVMPIINWNVLSWNAFNTLNLLNSLD